MGPRIRWALVILALALWVDDASKLVKPCQADSALRESERLPHQSAITCMQPYFFESDSQITRPDVGILTITSIIVRLRYR